MSLGNAGHLHDYYQQVSGGVIQHLHLHHGQIENYSSPIQLDSHEPLLPWEAWLTPNPSRRGSLEISAPSQASVQLLQQAVSSTLLGFNDDILDIDDFDTDWRSKGMNFPHTEPSIILDTVDPQMTLFGNSDIPTIYQATYLPVPTPAVLTEDCITETQADSLSSSSSPSTPATSVSSGSGRIYACSHTGCEYSSHNKNHVVYVILS